MTLPLCFDIDRGYVCNEPPDHDGNHKAWAMDPSTKNDEQRVVYEWPRRSVTDGEHR